MRPTSFFSRPLAAALTLLSLALLGVACDGEGPVVTSVQPSFAPSDSLVIVQGENLEGILEMRFDGRIVNFNTAFNADQALLFRVPRNLPPAEYDVTIETEDGTASFPFRVSEAAPQILGIVEEQAAIGEVIKIFGMNFFDDPLEVYFSAGVDAEERPLDSVPGEIVAATLDTVCVVVPPEARTGNVFVIANGGLARSGSSLEIVNALLITDFDGGGVRADTNDYFSRGGDIEQDRRIIRTFVDLHEDPMPIDGRYLKISGTRRNDAILGGLSIPRRGEAFGISSRANRTLLTFVSNNNGFEDTRVAIILTDTAGRAFALNTETLRLDDPAGWVRQAIPLSSFLDAGMAPVVPGALRSIGFFLVDPSTGDPVRMEANIDNVAVAEIL